MVRSSHDNERIRPPLQRRPARCCSALPRRCPLPARWGGTAGGASTPSRCDEGTQTTGGADSLTPVKGPSAKGVFFFMGTYAYMRTCAYGPVLPCTRIYARTLVYLPTCMCTCVYVHARPVCCTCVCVYVCVYVCACVLAYAWEGVVRSTHDNEHVPPIPRITGWVVLRHPPPYTQRAGIPHCSRDRTLRHVRRNARRMGHGNVC